MGFTEVFDDISGVEARASVLARFGMALIRILARCTFPSLIAVANTVHTLAMPAFLFTTWHFTAIRVARRVLSA